MKYLDDKVSAKKPFGRMRRNPDGWTDGEVVTPNGIVSVYAQDDEKFHLTRLDFAYEGTLYMRSWDKRYSPRGIVTKAYQFTQDIIKLNLPF